MKRNTVIGVSLAFLGIITLASVVGVSYQERATQNDMKKYLPPGEMIEVDGLRYHLNCVGAGAPTVILEAGLGENSLSWFPIQDEISKGTQVCSYDRAGLGWSEGTRKSFSLNQISETLYKLLRKGNIEAPYIMVGHSRGGIYVRNFYHNFSPEVTEIVFLDSTHEQT